MLKIVGTTDSSTSPCLINVNAYVPIAFRAQQGPLGGARYIRLGNFTNSLLELMVSADSMTVRGVTVTLVSKFHHVFMSGTDVGVAGLPTLGLPGNTEFVGPQSAQRVDVPCDFSLATSEDVVEISIQDNREFDSRISHGNICFLIKNEELVGIRFFGLDTESIDMIDSFARL